MTRSVVSVDLPKLFLVNSVRPIHCCCSLVRDERQLSGSSSSALSEAGLGGRKDCRGKSSSSLRPSRAGAGAGSGTGAGTGARSFGGRGRGSDGWSCRDTAFAVTQK